MKSTNLSSRILLLALLNLSSATVLLTKATDLKSAQSNDNNKNVSQSVSERSASHQMTAEPLSNDSVKQQRQSVRGGRMLDLDHLAGDIGKEQKMAKERSLSGQRQSRILTEDIQTGTTYNERSAQKSKAKKKMSIKGFIPIISLENAKEGKHYDNPLDSLTSANEGADDDEEESSSEQQQNTGGLTREQLMSNYGGQTSIGHASFGIQPDQQQQQQQWQQMSPGGQDQTEAARANRKLLGSSGILSGLSSPGKRFVSSLVPQQQQYQHIQGPMNVPMASQMMLQSQPADFAGDCMCVPFFQCKNGYLSESQLSKSQLSSLFSQQNHHHQQPPPPPHHHLSQQQQPQFALGHQIPRALSFSQAAGVDSSVNNYQQLQQSQNNFLSQLSPAQKQQLISQFGGQQMNDQQMNDLIYEQLRKNIESSNLEQQSLLEQQQLLQQQQQGSYGALLDERSKSGIQQVDTSNKTAQSESETGEILERSLLNPLGRRQSGQAKCGIMRTCCKIPPTLMAYQQARPFNPVNQQQHQFQQQQQQQQQQHNARLVSSRPQPQYQILQPTHQMNHQMNTEDYQVAPTSALAQHQQRPPVSRPQGSSFMAGRCGSRQTLGISGRVQNTQPAPGSETTAEFGEFPAHVAILKRLSPGDSMFVCSGSLVSNQWIVTAAHCIKKHRMNELKIRLGEWDVNRDDEFYPFMESNIREIIVHPDFQPSSLINDIALLRLETPVVPDQMPHIAPACLPAPEEVFSQQRCWVTGWGKDAFGQQGTFQSVLKKVDLPVVGHDDCENALRYQTKLGKFFRLHQSAICAGGERGKDACEGDGGAGLYCADPESGSIKVAGLVSWGVGCGQRGVPGVYTNLANLGPWIEQVVASSGEESLYLDRNSGTSLSNNNDQFKNIISERSNQQATGSNNGTILIENANNSTMTTQAPTEELESRAG